ncbi:MAG: SDR family NAD(P)-dependent oxidoreductase [Chloroflexi bacterium]|nr:SDR family NAD(P)-dependent oxidoreductase [Chloroflexota bacterium]
MGKLDGLVAVVTGAAHGMGRATAERFAREGAKVVVADFNVTVEGQPLASNPGQEVANGIAKAGGQATFIHTDVSNFAMAERTVAQTIEKYGKLDIVINIAGNLRERMIFNMSEEEWDAVIATHLKGTFNMTKFASIHWRQRREYGRVVSFTSGAWLGSTGQVNYCAAKGGIVSLMKACAMEMVRYKVNANAFAPMAWTRMNDRELEQQEAQKRGEPPRSTRAAGTYGDPANIPPILAYLSSPQAANVSGHVFGGYGSPPDVHRYVLYSDPEEVRAIYTTVPWDIDRLFEIFPLTLGKGLTLPGALTADQLRAGQQQPM